MKPFIKNLSKKHGGSSDAKKDSWGFQRRMIATLKRKTRRNRRRTDKLNLSDEA